MRRSAAEQIARRASVGDGRFVWLVVRDPADPDPYPFHALRADELLDALGPVEDGDVVAAFVEGRPG